MRMKLRVLTMLAALALVVSSFAGCNKTAKKFIVLDENFGSEEYGIGFRKDDIAFGLEVQKILDEMISDGTAGEISTKWFGEDILLKDGDYIKESQAPAGDKSLEKVKQAKSFTVGLDASFPPMGFTDEQNNIVGFDIDLAKEVASRMGVEVKFQPISWKAKEMELNSGKIDCIWNGMTILPDRVENMFFAKPYLANKQVIIVAENSDIATKADLKGKIIGLQQGSSSLDAFEKDIATKGSVKKVEEYEENVAVFMDLKIGRVNAFVVDEVVGRYLMSQNSKNSESK